MDGKLHVIIFLWEEPIMLDVLTKLMTKLALIHPYSLTVPPSITSLKLVKLILLIVELIIMTEMFVILLVVYLL